MLSILIPVSQHPWFIDAVLENYLSTGVDLSAVDLVFLTSHNVCDELEEVLTENTLDDVGYPLYRWLRSPLNQHNNHLPLLDWAFRNDSELREWVLVQHCDCFHAESGWLQYIQETLAQCEYGHGALSSPQGPEYRIRGSVRPVQVMHDYLGAYRRSTIVEHNLTFDWGRAGDLASPDLLARIQKGDVIGVTPDTWLDGSHALGLEFGLSPGLTAKRFRWHRHHHLWQWFKWANRISRDGNKIVIRGSEKYHPALMYYAWITSQFFDKSNTAVLPWALVRHLSRRRDKRMRDWLGKSLGYVIGEPIGLDDDGGYSLVWTGEDDLIRFTDN